MSAPPLLDRGWGLLALLQLCIIEDEAEALPPIWRALQKQGGPAWEWLETRHEDGWSPIAALGEVVADMHQRALIAPMGASWASRRASLVRWAMVSDAARMERLRRELHQRGVWRLPCGHTLLELDAPGVCEGCTWEARRRAGPA